MKKQILLSVLLLAAISMAVLAFTHEGEKAIEKSDLASGDIEESEPNEVETPVGPELPKFVFDVGPRHRAIKKSKLDQATSFNDFIGKEHQDRIVKYKSLSVFELKDGEKTEMELSSYTGDLTPAQQDYLKTVAINEEVLIWATYTEKWPEKDEIEESYWTPYLTVVPEKQARYKKGKDALIAYLNLQSSNLNAGKSEGLKPARIQFTIGEDGTISGLEVEAGSGNKELDHKIMDLISNTNGDWIPAENASGKKVSQNMLIYYGIMGC